VRRYQYDAAGNKTRETNERNQAVIFAYENGLVEPGTEATPG